MPQKHSSEKGSARGDVGEEDPAVCPFREFRDNDLGLDQWGHGPNGTGISQGQSPKTTSRNVAFEGIWKDDQVQPLPGSVRRSFSGWVRAEEVALSKWNATLVVCREPAVTGTKGVSEDIKMRSREIQFMFTDIIERSSFCRKVLSACYILERVENFSVEHQWENFTCAVGSEGWQPKLHILTPGMKPGGGAQHRPTLSRNGCYLVRLYFLGAWRCVWVSDEVPVDDKGNPLLPFAPPNNAPSPRGASYKGAKTQSSVALSVQMWPLLICKALLKLGAPDMQHNEGNEDEKMEYLDIMHCLTGSFSIRLHFKDSEDMWAFMVKEVPVFSWVSNDSPTSTVRSKASKKATVEDTLDLRRKSAVCMEVADTLGVPSYELAGLTPSHETSLLSVMVRDLPLHRPLDMPEVPLWKTHRWMDWARSHGLLDEYACPRKKFVKASCLLRTSHSPQLLTVMSNESIANMVAKEGAKLKKNMESGKKPISTATLTLENTVDTFWLDFLRLFKIVDAINVIYFPSMHSNFSAASNPSVRLYTKNVQESGTSHCMKLDHLIIHATHGVGQDVSMCPDVAHGFSNFQGAAKNTPAGQVLLHTTFEGPQPGDLRAPINAPLYLQVDCEESSSLRISLATVHPRILANAGSPRGSYAKPAYLFLEKFDWLSVDQEPPSAIAYLETRGYDAAKIDLPAGRYYFRIWINSALAWHCSVLSDASLVLCKRNVALGLAVLECPWATNTLSSISLAFSNWMKALAFGKNSLMAQYFYKSYAPNLPWDREIIGYPRAHLHWMMGRALQYLLRRNLTPTDYDATCTTLRRVFLDPNFGAQNLIKTAISTTILMGSNICDCPVEDLRESSEEMQHSPGRRDELKTMEYSKPLDVCKQIADAEIQEKLRMHKAAIVIQSHWKRVRCERLYKDVTPITHDDLKTISDLVFNTNKGMTSLMNIFFKLYPGARSAYTISTALGGGYDYQLHSGFANVTPRDRFIPLFNGTFYCHSPVRVHFDIECLLNQKTMVMFNNDTEAEVPIAANTHMTYNINPNTKGYAVHGHAWQVADGPVHAELHWKLTVLTSEEGAFHICNNAVPVCQEFGIDETTKMDLEELFIPNRRNILGAVQLFVYRPASVTMRVVSSYPEVKMRAVLRTVTPSNEVLASCSNTGELFWPHIGLEAPAMTFSHAIIPPYIVYQEHESSISSRQMKSKKNMMTSSRKIIKTNPSPSTICEPRVYEIEVVAPDGWPLTSAQWLMVDQVLNQDEIIKPVAAKQLQAEVEEPARAGAASFRLEVALPGGGGAEARRHAGRELAWLAERGAWRERARRHALGAAARDDFRKKYLLVPDSRSTLVFPLEFSEEEQSVAALQSVAVQSERNSIVVEERYLTKPVHLLDQFRALSFLPGCTKKATQRILVTPDMAEAALMQYRARVDAGYTRSDQLQRHNVKHVLAGQRRRLALLERLAVDGAWRKPLADALQGRDEALQMSIHRETSKNKIQTKKK